MEYKVFKPVNGDIIIHQFILPLIEVANCELSPKTIEKIMNLEASVSVADQLEILLEYFHALEGTDRVTSLAQAIRYIEEGFRYANKNPQNYSTAPVYFATSSYYKP